MSEQPKQQQPGSPLESHVARLEALIESLSEDVRVLSKRIGDLERDTKTPWATLIGGMALILTIVGFFISGYVRDQDDLRSEVQEMQERERQMLYQRGARDQQIESLQLQLSTLEAEIRSAERNP